jgi:elongation factor G
MSEKLRNIGVIAHVDAGKTTLTERMLLLSGAKHRAGAVDAGTTTTDSDAAERRMGITISSAAVTLDWGPARVTVIDTPGHVDFTAEVERSLRVLDGAVGVFCAKNGVEVQSEKVWFQADEHHVPRVAFVNKLDHDGADFFGCVAQLQDRLRVTPAVCAVPVGQGKAFEGVIDLVTLEFVHRKDDPGGKQSSRVEIPAEHRTDALRRREALLDLASRFDDHLAELLLAGAAVPAEALRAALRKGALLGKITPVLCGAAMRGHGVELLLDAVVDYLPSPADRGAVRGVAGREEVLRRPAADEPFAALAFKTVAEPAGDLVYVRVYSGELRPGQAVLNASARERERISRVRRMMGAQGIDLPTAGPGEIVALTGLRHTRTGDTLCAEEAPVVLEQIRFPEPVVSQAVVADPRTDAARLAGALARLVRDDPTLRFRTDPETKQLILSGMGELHLAISVEKLMRNPGVVVTAGTPLVAYRQTLRRPVRVETRFVRRSGGGHGMYAVLACLFEPLSREQEAAEAEALRAAGEKPDPLGVCFAERVEGGAVPREFFPAVEEGFREACRKGVRFGLPFMRVRCTLLEGKHHEVDSSPEAFRLAAMECFRDAQAQAGVDLLEPVMRVAVTGPEKYQGKVIGDLNRRRGAVQHFSCVQERFRLDAAVPLAELLGYTSDLRNATGGTAAFTMQPDGYALVKEELARLPG